MRTAGSNNTTPKYNCSIIYLGTEIHNKNYTSLKTLSDDIDMPYHTITDVFEGRRNSFMKIRRPKIFPGYKYSKVSGYRR
jgi:hypothetical protein